MWYTIEMNLLQSKIVVHYGDGRDDEHIVDIVTVDFSIPDGVKTAMHKAADAIADDLRSAGAL
jgi:hypothetical protein